MSDVPTFTPTGATEPIVSALWSDTRPAGVRGTVTLCGSTHNASRNAWGEVWVHTVDGKWFLASRASGQTFRADDTRESN